MEKFREFLKVNGSTLGTVAALLFGGVLIFSSYRMSCGPSETFLAANERPFVCAETKKGFTYTLQAGDRVPVYSPHSGKNTGFPAELCFWTADGKEKTSPTYVLMQPGGNFCPDCKRVVRLYNPRPGPGASPPPTRAEYEANRKTGREPGEPSEG
jgi:hypothetical protein